MRVWDIKTGQEGEIHQDEGYSRIRKYSRIREYNMIRKYSKIREYSRIRNTVG